MALQTFKTLADCVRIAELAHFSQTDKAGMPYIEHPRRVMQNVQTQGALPYVQMAAILHDVTEDTAFTCEMLFGLGVPEAAVNIVRLMDRGYSAELFDKMLHTSEYKTPDEFKALRDEFYYAEIRKNPGALQVKLADIGDNLQPWRLVYLPEETQNRLQKKYAKAIELLTK